MLQMIRGLKNGVSEKSLDYEEEYVIRQLYKLGIVYRSNRGFKALYKLSDNVTIKEAKNGVYFEKTPNRHMGIVFDYHDIFECVSDNKEAPQVYCLTYKLNPEEEDIRNFNLGEKVRVKVLARGYSNDNEGLLVRLPRSEEEYYDRKKDPSITIGLAEGAKSKNTCLLDFDEPVSGEFIEGKKALICNGRVYYDIKNIDVVSEIYLLDEKYGEYAVTKQSEIKFVR